MQTTNFWNQFHLHGKKSGSGYLKACCLVIALWLAAGISQPAFAQRRARNLPFYDEKKIHYGFQLAGMFSRYTLRYTPSFINDGDSTVAIYPMVSPGFAIGFVLNVRLSDDLWSLRFVPNAVFYERRVRFEYRGGAVSDRIGEATYVELPVLVKYKSERRLNTRMYMLGGLTGGIKVGGKKQAQAADQILTVNHNLELTYGFGFDLYMDMFKFAPELRFSHGIPNLFSRNNNDFAQGIGRLFSHKVTLYLNFE